MFFPEVTVELPGIVELEPSTELEPDSGESIDRACARLCAAASVEGRAWAMVFNGRRVVAKPGDEPRAVFERWANGRLL